jgi:hypothetical protein
MSGIVLQGQDVTDEQRAAHARKVSKANRAEALKPMAEIKAGVGQRKLVQAQRLSGTVQWLSPIHALSFVAVRPPPPAPVLHWPGKRSVGSRLV